MKKQLGFMIDVRRCVGCRTCMAACKMENRVPDGAFRMKVYNQEGKIFYDRPTGEEQLELSWTPTPCMHCRKPACEKVCSVGAILKRDDGIVYIDHDKCIGCEKCVSECPYGVPAFMGEYKKADKCDMCKHRVDTGNLPLCVISCPSRAITFGEADNPDSDLSKAVNAGRAKRQSPHSVQWSRMGNSPREPDCA